MPGNIISINCAEKYYVGDSKMPELIEFLAKIGVKQRKHNT